MLINIFHTNDIHSNFEFLKKVHSYVKSNKRECDLYFDSGDFTDLKSLIVQSDRGKSAIDLLNSLGLDAMTIGNNEIDLGHDDLREIARASYPIVTANLTDGDGNKIEGLKSSMIIERLGKKFLVIGVSPFYNERLKGDSYNDFFLLGNLRTHDPIKAINEQIAINEGNFDFVILLTHSGIFVDRKIAKECPGVDLFLGGHSHSKVAEENYSQSGRGELLGKITLSIGDDEIEIVDNIQVDLDEVEDEEYDIKYNEKLSFANQVLSVEIETCDDLDFDPLRESQLMNFLCDAMLKEYKADFAIIHNGIADAPLKRPVSKKTLLEIFPSKLNPTIYTIKGSRILEALKQSFDPDHIKQSGKGAGFRGYILGALSFSKNVKVTESPLKMHINDIELDPEKDYTIVTSDYLQRGSYYWSMEAPNEDVKYDKLFFRDLVEKYLADSELFESCNIRRITYARDKG